MKTNFKMNTANRSFRVRNAARRPGATKHRGVVTIYVLLIFGLLAGIAAVSFDLSYLYNRKAEAQKAADAAALAGAVKGDTVALTYAANNGYSSSTHATVTAGLNSTTGLYEVSLSRPERLEFARLFGLFVGNVGASASAQYLAPQDIPVQNYGVGNGDVNLSVFGPYAEHQNGDDYSPMFLGRIDGSQPKTANPDYTGKGYDFNIGVKGGISKFITDHPSTKMEFEIFDAGTGNADGSDSPTLGKAIDEIRPGWSSNKITETKYTLTYDNGTPSTADDVVFTKTIGADDATTDMKWLDAFDVDPNALASTTGKFTLNVTTTDGSSENGFQLRAGPAHDAAMDETTWNNTYGANESGGADVTVAAKGQIPMNFNTDATITINLGHVPSLPNGGSIKIDKFDLDVGSKSLVYHETPDAGGTGIVKDGFLYTPSGANNDLWTSDNITLPTGYAGGTWTAVYTAGWQDTSVWKMGYTGLGTLRLVR